MFKKGPNPLDINIGKTKNYLRGLTLIEIIISLLLIALTLMSLTGIFIFGKRYILHSRSRMAGGELGRFFLDPLQMYVRQDTWDESPVDPPPNNLLTVGNYKSVNNLFTEYSSYTAVSWLEEPNLNGITYYPVYRVEDNNGVRRVILTLRWTE